MSSATCSHDLLHLSRPENSDVMGLSTSRPVTVLFFVLNCAFLGFRLGCHQLRQFTLVDGSTIMTAHRFQLVTSRSEQAVSHVNTHIQTCCLYYPVPLSRIVKERYLKRTCLITAYREQKSRCCSRCNQSKAKVPCSLSEFAPDIIGMLSSILDFLMLLLLSPPFSFYNPPCCIES